MKRVVTVVGMVGLLGACANSPEQSPWLMSRGAATPMSCAPLSQDQELALNLAQKSADEGRVHAALANLERLPSGLPQANLYKARILRSLNRPEARELYTSLLGTCLKAQGEHGLGQLASAQGNYAEALDHLRLAATLDPTSDTIRNDLGVVYMNLGRMDEARFELLTALELNETEKQPALNLLTLLIYQGNLTQASALTERMGFSASEFRTAEQRAQTLRSKIGAGAGATAQPGAAKPAPRAQQSAPAGVAPAPKPVQTRPAPAPQPVAQVAIAPKAVSPTPVAAPRPPAVPAPQLSNFRPAPVVPLAIATAARSPASAVAPVVVASAPAAAPTSVAPRQVAAAPVVVSQPAAVAVAAAATPVAAPIVVAAAPVPAIAPASVTSSAPTPVAPRQVAAAPVIVSQPTAPAVAAAPTPVVAPVVVAAAPVASRQVAAAPVVVSQPAVAVAPTPAVAPVVASQPAAPAPASRSVASTPTAALANQVRAQIEMRPGRLIVPDDGGFIRVEPVSDLQGNAVANQR